MHPPPIPRLARCPLGPFSRPAPPMASHCGRLTTRAPSTRKKATRPRLSRQGKAGPASKPDGQPRPPTNRLRPAPPPAPTLLVRCMSKGDARERPSRGDERRSHLADHRGGRHLRRRRAQRRARARSGFAHLFEHMMFEGSANVGKGKHFKLVVRVTAAPSTARTSSDRTNYFEMLPPTSCRSRCGSKPTG